MKRNDFILVGIITALCILSILFFNFISNEGAYVIIKYDGTIHGTYPLSEDTTVRFPKTGSNYNIIEIRDNQVTISDADCPDLICKKHFPISKTGESIVCLPHKLSVVITDSSSETSNTVDAVSE